ncbi:MAG: hypothetical protein LUE31_05275 [Lachnospiraceae bacterium]|nr:hypothetical protein [Lachnospiraceae bacterium]
MWLIFIVVVLVITALMVFLLLAIRLLAGQAKDQLNRYFLKNLETYDRLAEHKNAEIDGLRQQEEELQERIDSLQERMDAMAEADQSRRGRTAAQSVISVETPAGAAYRDANFLEDYARVRRGMKLDWRARVKKLLEGLKDEADPQLALCRGMLEKLPDERLYDMVTLSDEDQARLLAELFDERERAFLSEWLEGRDDCDLIAFQTYLCDYIRAHEDQVYIRTGNPEELADLESERVHVLYDEGVHEGVRVSWKNTVYDFSL